MKKETKNHKNQNTNDNGNFVWEFDSNGVVSQNHSDSQYQMLLEGTYISKSNEGIEYLSIIR